MQCKIIDLRENRTRQVWTFVLLSGSNEFKVVVGHWAYETLPAHARKWRTHNWWDRFDNRNNNIKDHPAIPDEVRKQVKAFYAERVFNAVDTMKRYSLKASPPCGRDRRVSEA